MVGWSLQYCGIKLTRSQLPKAIRRLTADLTSLHESLPPNYLFSPNDDTQDDLSSLDILLVGPLHTPFCDGIWRLHFEIPANYPQQPPTANFRTHIFHPNVDSQTGSICVETLKRDWSSSLTLRDLLVTISCLLIQPNPDSALNAEAGALIQDGYEHFAKRARLMTSIHATVPSNLLQAAREAQRRGEDVPDSSRAVRSRTDAVDDRVRLRRVLGTADTQPPRVSRQPSEHSAESSESHPRESAGTRQEKRKRSQERMGSDTPRAMFDMSHLRTGTSSSEFEIHESDGPATIQHDLLRRSSSELLPPRRRQAAVRSRMATRQSHGSPVACVVKRRHEGQALNALATPSDSDSDSSIAESLQEDQENGPAPKSHALTPDLPAGSTPKRPPGPPTPLGELLLDSDGDTMDVEYPPSPRKNPVKHAAPMRRLDWSGINNAAPVSTHATTPAIFSDFDTPAHTPMTAGKGKARWHATTDTLHLAPSVSRDSHEAHGRMESIDRKVGDAGRISDGQQWSDERLWEFCAGDIRRWNRGDFDSQPFHSVASRW